VNVSKRRYLTWKIQLDCVRENWKTIQEQAYVVNLLQKPSYCVYTYLGVYQGSDCKRDGIKSRRRYSTVAPCYSYTESVDLLGTRDGPMSKYENRNKRLCTETNLRPADCILCLPKCVDRQGFNTSMKSNRWLFLTTTINYATRM
jgi:hypothetical protein